MTVDQFFQYLVSGLGIGSAYALVALGFAITYQGAKFFNFAHGEFYMLGAMLTFWVSVTFGLVTPLSILIAALAVAVIALICERFVFRRFVLAGAPAINLIIASLGLSSILRGTAMAVWGPEPQNVERVVTNKPVMHIGSSVIQSDLAVLMVTAAGLAIGLYLLLRYTRIGVAIRATANKINIVGLFGIELRLVMPSVLVISAVLGAVAGGFVAPTFKANVSMGVPILITAFAAAVLGGLGSIWGALVGGLTLGVGKSFASYFFGPNWSDVFIFSVVLVLLAVRPQGLVGHREKVKV